MGKYYLVHSQGAWKHHKYIKKIGDRYFYGDLKDSSGKMIDITDRLKKKDDTKKEETKDNKNKVTEETTSSKKSSKSSTKKTDEEKAAEKADKEAQKAAEKAAKASSKGGSGGSGGSSKSSEKEEKTSSKTETKSNQTVMDKAKEAISKVAKVSNSDSVSVSETDDGKFSVTVTYADKSTQTFSLDSSFKLLKYSMPEEVKHSEPLFWNPDEGLYHHGILGQKWGIRRYQNPDGTLTNAGRRRVSSRYQNIDGSLNERGIDHRYKFADKKIAKNNKYYDKQVKKYEKKLEKTDNEEEKEAIKSRIANAENTRKQVNDYIKNMDIENIVSIENEAKQKALNIAGAAAGLATATGLGIAAPRYVAKGLASVGNFMSNLDPNQTIDSLYAMADTEQGRKAMSYVDTGLRSYADVRAYVISTMADQAIKRMNENGTFDQIADVASQVSGNTTERVGNTMAIEMNRLLKQYG